MGTGLPVWDLCGHPPLSPFWLDAPAPVLVLVPVPAAHTPLETVLGRRRPGLREQEGRCAKEEEALRLALGAPAYTLGKHAGLKRLCPAAGQKLCPSCGLWVAVCQTLCLAV